MSVTYRVRYVGLAIGIGVLLLHGGASADTVTSGTATRVGEPPSPIPSNPEGEGRAKIRVCGTISASVPDLRACTFNLNDIGFDVTPASVYGIFPAARGGKATEATYQNNSRARPSIKAQFKKKSNDLMEFCVTIDRAAIAVEPFGIDIEPCVDGQTTTHGLWFDLTCPDGGTEFEQEATWRVPTNICPQDFPNMRTP